MDGDTHRYGELRLREPDEPAKRSDILTGLEDPGYETLSDPCRDGTRKITFGEFRNVVHVDAAMWSSDLPSVPRTKSSVNG